MKRQKMLVHTCSACGHRRMAYMLPKERAIRWLYRRPRLIQPDLRPTDWGKGAWNLYAELFRRIGLYRPTSPTANIPVGRIVAEARRRHKVGAGLWRTEKQRSSSSRGRHARF